MYFTVQTKRNRQWYFVSKSTVWQNCSIDQEKVFTVWGNLMVQIKRPYSEFRSYTSLLCNCFKDLILKNEPVVLHSVAGLIF